MQPSSVLSRSAEEAARLTALSLLETVRVNRRRLEQLGEQEALHDFRVSLRRLRSCLRAYRPELRRAVSGGTRRRLRAVAEASRESRDLEVHLAWLRDQCPGLPPRQAVGADWIVHRLELRKWRADQEFRSVLARDFERGLSDLERELRGGGPRPALDPERPGDAAVVVGSRVRGLAGDLECALAEVHALGDASQAHAARIAAKRLRYLLEPIATSAQAADELIDRLRHLQDDLGDLHDTHVFVQELAKALDAAGVEQAHRLSEEVRSWSGWPVPAVMDDDARPGLLALARRIKERGASAFARVEAHWLNGAADEFFQRVAEFGRSIAMRPAAAEWVGPVATLYRPAAPKLVAAVCSA